MRIAIVGAGAIGGLFGGLLAEGGQLVQLIDVPGPHLQALMAGGLLLDTDAGARRIPVPAGRAGDTTGVADLILVLTKGHHTTEAAQSVAHLAGPQTCVLTLQNGLGNAERIADALPGLRLLIGMTTWPADLAGPGHVTSHGQGEIRIWAADGSADPAVPVIAATLSAAGLACTADPAVEVAIWEKVAFNAALNAVAAATRLHVAPIADSVAGQRIVAAVIDEVLAVARARGHAVDAARVHAAVAKACRAQRAHKPSMLQDVLAGRQTEVAAINGAVVAAGERLGIATPVTRTLCDLVLLIDSARPV